MQRYRAFDARFLRSEKYCKSYLAAPVGLAHAQMSLLQFVRHTQENCVWKDFFHDWIYDDEESLAALRVCSRATWAQAGWATLRAPKLFIAAVGNISILFDLDVQ